MEIKVSEIDYCKFNVDVVAPRNSVQEKRKEVLNSFKNAPCPGFRKGKATKEAVEIYYKSQIEDAVKRAMAEDAFHETLFQQEWKNLGSPNFKTMLLKDGKYFCNFDLDIIPKFELKDVKNITVPSIPQAESVADVTAQKMEELRQRFGETKFFEESDFVENGDSIIISYEATDNGVKVDQLCAESEVVTVGVRTDKDFSDNLLGMRVGESREFDYVIKPHAQSSLAGKTVKFNVKVSNGTKTVPHALNDDLAMKMNKQNLLELQEHVKSIAAGIVDTRVRQQLQQSVSNVLVEMHDFKVQDWLVEKEALMLCRASKIEYQFLVEEDKNSWRNTARKNVKLSIILDKIREVEPEAQMTDQEMVEYLKQMFVNDLKGDTSTEALLKLLAPMGANSQVLFARVRDEHALNFVVKNAKVVQ